MAMIYLHGSTHRRVYCGARTQLFHLCSIVPEYLLCFYTNNLLYTLETHTKIFSKFTEICLFFSNIFFVE